MEVINGVFQTEPNNGIPITTLFLVGMTTGASVLSLWFLFRYSALWNRPDARHSEEIHRLVEQDQIRQKYHLVEDIQADRAELRDVLDDLQRSLDNETQEDKQKEIRTQIENQNKAISSIERKLEKQKHTIEAEAQKYADEYVAANVKPATQFGPYFYLEFTAIIIVISALLVLAILQVIEGQDAVTILAAIVGYVLGKATAPPVSSNPS